MLAAARVIGRCGLLFLIALIFDVVGVVLLLIGIFSSLPYWDFFIYTGAVVVALSLVWWTFWYTVNIEIPERKILGMRTA